MRNNSLTEKCEELEYKLDGVVRLAKWNDLKMLYNAETGEVLKLSHLDQTSALQSPIARQKVRPCSKVLHDETAAALETHLPTHSWIFCDIADVI